MTQYIHLIGAEDVNRAASRISSAASDMIRAANIIDNAVLMFKQDIDRLEQIKEEILKFAEPNMNF